MSNVITVYFASIIFSLVPYGSLQKAGGEKKQLILPDVLLFASTLNGTFYAINQKSGEVKWSRQENHVVEAPLRIDRDGTFLPNPHDGSLYVHFDAQENLHKLPFTIPELVRASPCRSSDGILYVGSKRDVWHAIDPATGVKQHRLTKDGVEDDMCPPVDNTKSHMYIGRTEYTVSMFDGGKQKWNVTYYDYAAGKIESTKYDLMHFISSSSGRCLTIDQLTGEISWEMTLNSPIVGIYTWHPEGLQEVPVTVVAEETIDSIVSSASAGETSRYIGGELVLKPTLFVGEYTNSFYAIPTLVDEKQAIIDLKTPKIEGPINQKNGTKEKPKRQNYHGPPSGYHTVPIKSPATLLDKRGITQEPAIPRPPNRNHRLRYKQILLLLTSILVPILIIFMIFCCKRRSSTPEIHSTAPTSHHSVASNLSNGSTVSNDSRASIDYPVEDENGFIHIGKIMFCPKNILGRGCGGTTVFEGKFDQREAAVKRILPESFNFAEREVELLRQSDDNSNVIRYFCTEEDRHFRYIALELCQATLQDYVKKPSRYALSASEILFQALSGLNYLHSLNIVHRDIKPQNVLISYPNVHGEVKAKISDFGMCKKLATGRHSFSTRSGLGTEGWIAPEVLNSNKKLTRACDVFSYGCVFYYVLSGGKHPFGDSYQRQGNIITGKHNIELDSTENEIEAHGLLKQMLKVNPSKRPTTAQMLKHPFYWDKERILLFFQDVSDRIEKEVETSYIVNALQNNSIAVVRGDWKMHIGKLLQEDLRRFRTYQGTHVRDLLRAMRNKKHHYRELPEELREELGTIPDEYVSYFLKRFPRLLMHTYHTLKPFCADEPPLSSYYYQK